MKSIQLFITAIALLFATTAFAQDIPKKEFTVSISDKNIQVLPGETKQIEVKLNRSKSFRKTQIDLAMGSTLPDGVTVSFIEGTNPVTDRIMVIAAAADAQPFEKTIILNAKSSRATKGVMMNVSLDAQTLSIK